MIKATINVPRIILNIVTPNKRLLNLEKDILKMQVLADLDYLAEKNKDISFEELDKDIEYSKKHASRNY